MMPSHVRTLKKERPAKKGERIGSWNNGRVAPTSIYYYRAERERETGGRTQKKRRKSKDVAFQINFRLQVF